MINQERTLLFLKNYPEIQNPKGVTQKAIEWVREEVIRSLLASMLYKVLKTDFVEQRSLILNTWKQQGSDTRTIDNETESHAQVLARLDESHQLELYSDSISIPEKGMGRVNIYFCLPESPTQKSTLELFYTDGRLDAVDMSISTPDGVVYLTRKGEVNSPKDLKPVLGYFTTNDKYTLLSSITNQLNTIGFNFKTD